jgi:hypothetical protein
VTLSVTVAPEVAVMVEVTANHLETTSCYLKLSSHSMRCYSQPLPSWPSRQPQLPRPSPPSTSAPHQEPVP